MLKESWSGSRRRPSRYASMTAESSSGEAGSWPRAAATSSSAASTAARIATSPGSKGRGSRQARSAASQARATSRSIPVSIVAATASARNTASRMLDPGDCAALCGSPGPAEPASTFEALRARLHARAASDASMLHVKTRTGCPGSPNAGGNPRTYASKISGNQKGIAPGTTFRHFRTTYEEAGATYEEADHHLRRRYRRCRRCRRWRFRPPSREKAAPVPTRNEPWFWFTSPAGRTKKASPKTAHSLRRRRRRGAGRRRAPLARGLEVKTAVRDGRALVSARLREVRTCPRVSASDSARFWGDALRGLYARTPVVVARSHATIVRRRKC